MMPSTCSTPSILKAGILYNKVKSWKNILGGFLGQENDKINFEKITYLKRSVVGACYKLVSR